MASLRYLIAGTTILALAGCDDRTAPPSPASTAPANLALPEIPPNATTAGIAGLFHAAGLEIPAPIAIATLPWGQLPGFKVVAKNAAKEWERLRAATDNTGYYPVITLDKYGFLGDLAEVGSHDTIDDMLKHAATIDPVSWFNAKEKENAEYPDYKVPRGPWEASTPHTGLLSLRDNNGQWEPEVYILLLPTRDPWQAALYLGWGNWNACPEPSIHAALFKRWQQLYGAEPMLITQDIIEARVSRPPNTKDAAMALAREHFLYCSDIVDQGVGTLDALGAGLKDATYWYFWWD